jgi:hypothetical protein
MFSSMEEDVFDVTSSLMDEEDGRWGFYNATLIYSVWPHICHLNRGRYVDDCVFIACALCVNLLRPRVSVLCSILPSIRRCYV